MIISVEVRLGHQSSGLEVVSIPLTTSANGSFEERVGPLEVSARHQREVNGTRWFLQAVNLSESAVTATLSFCLSLVGWDESGYLMMPGAVYAGNEFEVQKATYPPMFDIERPADGPPIITEVPRLPSVELLSGDMATPAVGAYLPSTSRGYLLFSSDRCAHGYTGFHVEQREETGELAIRVEAPGVRSKRYGSMQTDLHSPDQPARLETNGSLTLEIFLADSEMSSVQDLFQSYFELRESVVSPGELVNQLPFSEAFRIIEEKYHLDNWFDDYQIFGTATKESTSFIFQPGWVGGGMASYALERDGGDLARERARRTADFLCKEAMAESGLFKGIFNGDHWAGDGFDAKHAADWVLVRKSADATYFLAKHIRVVQSRGEEVPRLWLRSLARAAGALADLWRNNGQFGQFVDLKSGRIAIGGSESAGMAPGALALASLVLGDSSLNDIAIESGRALADRAIRNGFTTGGPGEILQCPDSESCAGLLESVTMLWVTSGNREWLSRAVALAHQLASWVVSYDFDFPSASLFGALGMKTTGTVIANAQNKHSAPGICTLSPLSLFVVWRETQDPLLLQLSTQVAHSIVQYLSRQDRPVGPLKPGWMCERVNMSDWELEWFGVGGIFNGSCWCEISTLLTFAEMPGVYVRPSDGFVHAFDHVCVSPEFRGTGLSGIEIQNPTDFPASVKVFVDHDPAALPIGLVLSGMQVYDVPPRGSITVELA